MLYNNCNSDLVDVTTGVPQGSILGLLLVSIFINDLRGAGMMNYKNIDRISLFILYRFWKATVVCFNLV